MPQKQIKNANSTRVPIGLFTHTTCPIGPLVPIDNSVSGAVKESQETLGENSAMIVCTFGIVVKSSLIKVLVCQKLLREVASWVR